MSPLGEALPPIAREDPALDVAEIEFDRAHALAHLTAAYDRAIRRTAINLHLAASEAQAPSAYPAASNIKSYNADPLFKSVLVSPCSPVLALFKLYLKNCGRCCDYG
jgi:hypothetical protein